MRLAGGSSMLEDSVVEWDWLARRKHWRCVRLRLRDGAIEEKEWRRFVVLLVEKPQAVRDLE